MYKNKKPKTSKLNKRILIFDFDFTLADSLEIGLKFYNRIAPKFGATTINKNQLKTYRELEIKSLMKKLNLNFLNIPIISLYVKLKLMQNQEEVKIMKGIKSLLKELKQKGYCLGILSSNSKVNIYYFLVKEKIPYFDFIETERDVFGKHKMMRKLLKHRNLSSKDVIYIGDEVRDIEAMRKLAIPVISVSWGLSSEKLLNRHNPDLVANSPTDILTKLENLEMIL